jgi:hypothetical protein
MRRFFNIVIIMLLIACVNILWFTLTCYSPLYSSDGHQHTFFHLFKFNSDEHSETHSNPDPHSHTHQCSLDSRASMIVILSVMTCDLCMGQESLAIHTNPISKKMLSDRTLFLPRNVLHPPTEPPEFS